MSVFAAYYLITFAPGLLISAKDKLGFIVGIIFVEPQQKKNRNKERQKDRTRMTINGGSENCLDFLPLFSSQGILSYPNCILLLEFVEMCCLCPALRSGIIN